MGYQTPPFFLLLYIVKIYICYIKLKIFFRVGKITKHGKTFSQYTVKSFKYLEIRISHFYNYPLLGKKWAYYTIFKDGVQLIKDKEHLNIQGFNKVLCIRDYMNLGLP